VAVQEKRRPLRKPGIQEYWRRRSKTNTKRRSQRIRRRVAAIRGQEEKDGEEMEAPGVG
jgi:hypothetical protein